jgi:WD40 repeat protein
VHIWRLSAGELRTVHTSPGGSVRTLAFAPDGHTLAVVDIKTGGDRITLLDAATGRTERTIDPGPRSLLTLAFSPDGHALATASGSNGLVKTWDTRTGHLEDAFSVSAEVWSLAFTPDARTLAASTVRGVQLWDLATSQSRTTLPARSPGTVAFSPDGRTLAIGTGSSVGLWNVDLPDVTHAIRAICEAVDRTLTPVEQARYPDTRSTETGCQETAR